MIPSPLEHHRDPGEDERVLEGWRKASLSHSFTKLRNPMNSLGRPMKALDIEK